MLTRTLLLLRIKERVRGKRKVKGVVKDKEKVNCQMKEKALVISLRLLGSALTMHVSASARRTTAHFSMYPLASCVKPSAARQDRDLVRPLSDSDLRGLNVANHKEERTKGKGRGKSKSDALPSKEGEGKIDMQVLPAVVRRQLSRPRWCSDYLKGCCNKNLCPCPHHSEQVVSEIKEKESIFKSAAAARPESSGRRTSSRGRSSKPDC